MDNKMISMYEDMIASYVMKKYVNKINNIK